MPLTAVVFLSLVVFAFALFSAILLYARHVTKS